MSISVREWALAAGISKRAMLDYRKDGERRLGVISRLKKRGLIRSDKAGRREGEAGAFVLVLPRAEFHHSSTGIVSGVSGETLRAPRLRWSAPVQRTGDEVICSVVKRLGKGCGAVIDALERAGGSATVEQLAAMLHKSRALDLRRREIDRLEKAGVVECSGQTCTAAAVRIGCGPISISTEQPSAASVRTLSANCTGWRECRRQYPASSGVCAVSTAPVRLQTSGSVGAANCNCAA